MNTIRTSETHNLVFKGTSSEKQNTSSGNHNVADTIQRCVCFHRISRQSMTFIKMLWCFDRHKFVQWAEKLRRYLCIPCTKQHL